MLCIFIGESEIDGWQNACCMHVIYYHVLLALAIQLLFLLPFLLSFCFVSIVLCFWYTPLKSYCRNLKCIRIPSQPWYKNVWVYLLCSISIHKSTSLQCTLSLDKLNKLVFIKHKNVTKCKKKMQTVLNILNHKA